MIAEDKDNEPKDEDLWQDVLAVTKGEKNSVSRTVDGEEVTVEAPNDGDGFDVYPSAYANGWAVQRYEDLGGEWKTVDESLYMKLAEDLDTWFDEEWVDITEPKEDGEYPACGATADDPEREKDPRKNYPKCVPKSKVDKLSDEEIEDLARKKQKAVDDAESDLESDDGDSDEPVRTDTDGAVEDSYSYRATTYSTGTQRPNVMRESDLRKLVREELLREQSSQPFTYDRGCMAFFTSRDRVRLEFDLVGSTDAYLDLRGEWPSMYRAQGGDRFARELEQMNDGQYIDCTITGEAAEGVGATDIELVRFELGGRTVFEVQGRDADRFYNNVLLAPLNLSDPEVVDSLSRGQYWPA